MAAVSAILVTFHPLGTVTKTLTVREELPTVRKSTGLREVREQL